MTQEAKKQRENKEEEARAELIKKYGEPFISGTEEVVEQVEEGAPIETVSSYLSRNAPLFRNIIKEVGFITEEGFVITRQQREGKTVGLGGVLPFGTEFWVISSEPKDES